MLTSDQLVRGMPVQLIDPATGQPVSYSNSASALSKAAGASICDWQKNGTLTLSAGTAATAALDTSVLLFGKPTLKCVFSSAASDTYIATFTLTNPARLKDIKNIQIPILFTNNASGNGNIGSSSAPFQIWLGTSNSKSIRIQCDFSNLQPGVWTTLAFSRNAVSVITNAISELDASGVTVTTVKIVQATNNTAANSYPVWVGEIIADAKINKGYVTLVMDGEYSSQYTDLFPLLTTYGLKSSLAITTADIGGVGRMTLAQIQEMKNAGHEPISHTYDSSKSGGYGNATDWPTAADITDDLRSQWAYFDTQGWDDGIGYGVWGFSYGFVSSNTLARQNLVASALRAGGMQAMRKSVPYNGEATAGCLIPLHKMPVDPFVLSGAIQITSTHSFADVITCIDQAEATGSWAIITAHRSVTSSPGSLEMTKANFETWMSYANGRVNQGTLVVDTFSKVFNKFFKPEALAA
ncbi:MAG: hypothetical protein V4501_08165 [Pseudomonadota bacterium]